MSTRVVVVLGIIIAVAWPAEDALGCSCVGGSAATAKVGFTATPTSRRKVGGNARTGPIFRYRLRVNKVYRGALPRRITLTASENSFLCGVTLPLRRKVTMALATRYKRGQQVGACDVVSPKDFRPQRKPPLPKPTGRGQAVALVDGQFGRNGRFVALDRDGELLAYGLGPADAFAMSVCPGSSTLLQYGGDNLHVRRLSDLQFTRSQRISARLGALRCRTADGSRALGILAGRDEDSPSRLVELTPQGQRSIVSFLGEALEMTEQHVIARVGSGGSGNRIERTDTATGAKTFSTELHGELISFKVDSTAAQMALTSQASDGRYRLHILDLSTGQLRTHPLRYQGFGDIVWLPGEQIGVVNGADRLVRHRLTDLERVRVDPGPFGLTVVVVGDELWTDGPNDSDLSSAPVTGGATRRLVRLHTDEIGDIHPVPGIEAWSSVPTRAPAPLAATARTRRLRKSCFGTVEPRGRAVAIGPRAAGA